MAVQGVSIALSTEDVARSAKFYVEQLGFTCTLQLEGFARIRFGAANIMLAQPNAHLPWQGPRLTGSIYLTSIMWMSCGKVLKLARASFIQSRLWSTACASSAY